MKVKDLIEELQKCNPDLDVCIYDEYSLSAESALKIEQSLVNHDGELATRKDLEDDEWTQEEINASFEECVVIFS